MPTKFLRPHLKWLIPVGIVAVAAFFRLYQLDRIPPAFNFDEAAHATDALEILGGRHFIFSPKIGGVEAFFMYLTAGMFALLGAQPLSQRLIAAIVGIATVAAAYCLTRTLFADENDRRATWLAALTALGLAVSFWHIDYSRIGLEVNLTPFFAVLSFWFLWRGLRSGRAWDFVWSGVWMGVGPYGHLPARFLPFPVVTFFALMWVLGPARPKSAEDRARRGAVPLLLVAAAALVVFAPLGYYFASHPADFLGRASNTSIFNPAMNRGDFWGTLWRSAIGTFGAFGFTADTVWIANLPGKSILSPALAVLFWLGVLVSLVRAVTRPFESKRAPGPGGPYLFALLWWVLLLIPAVITPERTPHYARMMSVAPVAYLFPAVGLTALAGELQAAINPMRTLWFSVVDPELRFAIGYPDHAPRWQRNLQLGLKAVGWASVAALFVATAYSTYHDYFDVWAASPAHYMTFDGYAAELVSVMEADGDPLSVYVLPRDVRAGEFYPHYTIDFLHRSGAPHLYLPMREPEVPAMLTQAVAGKQVVHLVKWKMDKHREADPKDYVAWLLEVYGQQTERRSYDAYDVVTYRLPSPGVNFVERPWMAESARPNVTFGELLSLDMAAIGNASAGSLDVSHDVASGGKLWVALGWRLLHDTDGDYRASIMLEDDAGHLLGSVDRDLIHGWHMRTSGWPIEDPVGDYYLLPVPPGVLPGPYRVSVALYNAESLRRLPLDSTGRTAAVIDQGRILPAAERWEPDGGDGIALDADCPNAGMRLRGADLDLSRSYGPGEKLTAGLRWSREHASGGDCRYAFALRWPEGEALLTTPRRVGGDAYPGSAWRQGEQYRVLDDLRIPADTPSGLHSLVLSLASGTVTDTTALGEMRVEGRPHRFDVPPVPHPLEANFGRVARLLGFELNQEDLRPGGSLDLTLVWQALDETAVSYTVFVHLLDAAGRVAAQRDAPPLEGQAPTSSWLPGEVIEDGGRLAIGPDVPAGRYQVEVGLYDPETGERLPAGAEDRVVLGEIEIR